MMNQDLKMKNHNFVFITNNTNIKQNTMDNFREYKIDFVNYFNGDKRTITLSNSKEGAREVLKSVKKRFSLWWRRSVIYC